MKGKIMVRLLGWLLNILVIFILVWSLINYKILNQEVSQFVQIGGLLAMIFLIILLEGAPVFLGSSIVVVSVLEMNIINPWIILLLFLVSAIMGNIIYFYIGYASGKRILKYFEKKDVKRYEGLFKKYGWVAMMIMAVSPVPYLPTLAGVFRMNSLHLIASVLVLRMIRHTIVFLFLLFVLVGF